MPSLWKPSSARCLALLLALLSAVPPVVLSQSFEATTQTWSAPREEAALRKALAGRTLQRLPPGAQWRQVAMRQSPLGKHRTYEAILDSVVLDGAFLKLRLGKGFATDRLSHRLPDERYSTAEARFPPPQSWPDTVYALGDTFALAATTHEPRWRLHRGQWVPSLALAHPTASGHEWAIVDLQGRLLDREPLSRRSGPKRDTSLQLDIFLPDPVTTAETVYGAPYVDNDDRNTSALEAEIKRRAAPGRFRNDSFFLETAFLRIADLAAPSDSFYWSATSTFYFQRDQAPFEAVNVFYHATQHYRQLQALGFDSLLDYQLPVDPHGSTRDISLYDVTPGSNRGKLLFGDGGVDDGEDADVIVHELSHALAASLSPQSAQGYERRALEEGFCDYFAASYSRRLSAHRWQEVFNWDGQNEFWRGRSVQVNRRYPEAVQGNNIWGDGELWSSPLMNLWGRIGPGATDKLMTQIMYDLFSGMAIGDALTLLLDADQALYDGRHEADINRAFSQYGYGNFVTDLNEKKGEGSATCVRVEEVGFREQGRLAFEIKDTALGGGQVHWQLVDVTGRRVAAGELRAVAHKRYEVATSVGPGVYIFQLEGEAQGVQCQQQRKLIRY
jgi:hypothetical protein